MKRWQEFCIWIVFGILITTGIILGFYVLLIALNPLIKDLEHSGLKGIVEDIWCGKDGCNP